MVEALLRSALPSTGEATVKIEWYRGWAWPCEYTLAAHDGAWRCIDVGPLTIKFLLAPLSTGQEER